MTQKELNEHIISRDASLIEALQQLNSLSGKAMTLFAIDSDGTLCGTLTDGDIRRSLISRRELDIKVSEIMHTTFRYLEEGNIDLAAVRNFRSKMITFVPVLDAQKRVVNVYDFSQYRSILPLDAVLMAGGKGERLRPMTLTTPKPLLKIGDKCIIDYNIEELSRNGIENISVTTNYLAEQLDEHFREPVAGVKVRCVREPKKLGTIGSIKLVDGLTHENVLVMNSDLLTTVSYEDMFMEHISQGADMTIAAIPYMVSVPFAILHSEGDRITALEEKPTFNYYANAGIYIIRKECLDAIPADSVYDATDLIDDLIKAGKKVIYSPINGVWLDIGSPDDFRHAQEIVKNKQLSNL